MEKKLVFVVIIVIVVTFILYNCLIQNNETQDTTLLVKDILIDITQVWRHILPIPYMSGLKASQL